MISERKSLAVIALVCALPALVGCGDHGLSGRAERREELRQTRPKFQPHQGSPPSALVVRVVKKGSGHAAREGDRLGILYVGFDDETGEEMYRRWALHPLPFTLGSEYLAAGLERGLIGIRLGERRELILPPRLAYGRETIEYFVQLATLNGHRASLDSG